MKHAIVIGAGISGMGAAYALQKKGFKVTVLEKNKQAGGRMLSINWQGNWIDVGAEYLSNKENELFKLIKELGLSSRVLDYPTIGQVTFESWRHNRGNVVSLSKPLSILTTAPLSIRGKMRLLSLIPACLPHIIRVKFRPQDVYKPSAVSFQDDESLEEWLSRVNPELLEYVVEPMHEFMWSHEPHEISKGWALEFYAKHVTLDVCSLDEGYGLLPRVFAKKLDVITSASVKRVDPGKTPVIVEWEHDGQQHRAEVDGVIVAVPGTRVKDIVQGLDAERVKFFDGVKYSPQEIPFFKLNREVAGLPMMRLYSRKEDPVLNAIIYTALQPGGKKIFRAKLKAEYIKRYWHQTDSERMDAVQKEAARYFPEAAEAIEDRILHRWHDGLPIFYPGYSRSLEKFLALPPIPGLVFAGDYLTQGHTGAAYQSGLWAAQDLMKQLA